ncbi:hypothetical protein GE21DRAFT_1091413 [Neurospora crassa]|nr:hypothetical protein GE21DRAFT_1091413 [Neurospora crassa]
MRRNTPVGTYIFGSILTTNKKMHLTSPGLSSIAACLLCSGQGSSCGHAYMCIPTGSNPSDLIGLPVQFIVRR